MRVPNILSRDGGDVRNYGLHRSPQQMPRRYRERHTTNIMSSGLDDSLILHNRRTTAMSTQYRQDFRSLSTQTR